MISPDARRLLPGLRGSGDGAGVDTAESLPLGEGADVVEAPPGRRCWAGP